jgi:hypothetical protein
MDARPLTREGFMKYRLYGLAVTFAMLVSVVGHVGTMGAKWG